MLPVALNDTFRFSCSKLAPCFNECCQDLNQFLTPYDILRLKNRLNMSSGEFLKRYTTQHTGPGSGLPVITFKADYNLGLKCPFVTSSGCSVYSDRPSSCRSYPIARLVSRSRPTGKITEQYMLTKESHCFGFKDGQTWTVSQWIKDQGLSIYNKTNDLLLEIISLKNKFKPGRLDIKTNLLINMAFYDLDTFKNQIFEKDILENFNPEAETLNAAKNDDLKLLKLGIRWIKSILEQYYET